MLKTKSAVVPFNAVEPPYGPDRVRSRPAVLCPENEIDTQTDHQGPREPLQGELFIQEEG